MRAFAAASVLAASLAVAGCAGASPPPAPYKTPSVPASPSIAPPPPPLVPDTRADRQACSEFADAAIGKITRARFADWTGNHDVRAKLLAPITAWLAGTGGQGPVVADCETIGGI